MTRVEKIELFKVMLGDDTVEDDLVSTYLDLAKEKILNHRFPFETPARRPLDVEPMYERDECELAIILFNTRGAEGQETHNENGVNRKWRTESQILSSIPRRAGIPL